MKIDNLEYEITTAKTTDLQPHSLLTEMGLHNDKFTDDIIEKSYLTEVKQIGYHEPILITRENSILSNFHAWHAAKRLSKAEVDVVVVKNLKDDDAIRLVNVSSTFFRRSYKGRIRWFMAWRKYLKSNPKGIEFSKTVKGRIIADKISTLTGWGSSTVRMYLDIAPFDDLVQRLENFEPITRLVDEARAREDYKGDDDEFFEDISTDAISASKKGATKSSQPFTSKQLGYEKELYNVQFEDGIPSVRFQNQKVELVPQKIIYKKKCIVYPYTSPNSGFRLEVSLLNPKALYDDSKK